jgi:plasmid stability protein
MLPVAIESGSRLPQGVEYFRGFAGSRGLREMQELLLTDVDDGVLEDLRQRATRHGRTPAEEATEILAEALRSKRHDVWEPVDAIYQRLAASGRTFTDSADLLREDRDR